jgi:hypothetical protein
MEKRESFLSAVEEGLESASGRRSLALSHLFVGATSTVSAFFTLPFVTEVVEGDENSINRESMPANDTADGELSPGEVLFRCILCILCTIVAVCAHSGESEEIQNAQTPTYVNDNTLVELCSFEQQPLKANQLNDSSEYPFVHKFLKGMKRMWKSILFVTVNGFVVLATVVAALSASHLKLYLR